MSGRASDFGPWAPDLADGERLAPCRAFRAIAAIMCGPAHPLVVKLLLAEADSDAATAARQELDKLPALQRRRVLASYAALATPGRPRRQTRKLKETPE